MKNRYLESLKVAIGRCLKSGSYGFVSLGKYEIRVEKVHDMDVILYISRNGTQISGAEIYVGVMGYVEGFYHDGFVERQKTSFRGIDVVLEWVYGLLPDTMADPGAIDLCEVEYGDIDMA